MQLCCRIRLELSEQIIPAKGSQEPLPNGGSADKAAFSEMIMEAELLMLCEQGCTACGMCRSCPVHLAGGLVSSHPRELLAPVGKNQSNALLCDRSHISARSTWMQGKRSDQFYSLQAF